MGWADGDLPARLSMRSLPHSTARGPPALLPVGRGARADQPRPSCAQGFVHRDRLGYGPAGVPPEGWLEGP
jgi:hypothetical protein